MTTKLSDNYVWDKEDDIAIKAGRLSGIIKELKALSDQSIEEIRSSEIEAIVPIYLSEKYKPARRIDF